MEEKDRSNPRKQAARQVAAERRAEKKRRKEEDKFLQWVVFRERQLLRWLWDIRPPIQEENLARFTTITGKAIEIAIQVVEEVLTERQLCDAKNYPVHIIRA
jgi:hypothetical protein